MSAWTLDAPGSDDPPEWELHPLGGIRWPSGSTRRPTAAGEVAMFDVTDPGELQEW